MTIKKTKVDRIDEIVAVIERARKPSLSLKEIQERLPEVNERTLRRYLTIAENSFLIKRAEGSSHYAPLLEKRLPNDKEEQLFMEKAASVIKHYFGQKKPLRTSKMKGELVKLHRDIEKVIKHIKVIGDDATPYLLGGSESKVQYEEASLLSGLCYFETMAKRIENAIPLVENESIETGDNKGGRDQDTRLTGIIRSLANFYRTELGLVPTFSSDPDSGDPTDFCQFYHLLERALKSYCADINDERWVEPTLLAKKIREVLHLEKEFKM